MGQRTGSVRGATVGELAWAGTALLLVVGVYVDGWAHLNRPGLDTFFTPWHAMLYGGAALYVVTLMTTWCTGQPRGTATDVLRGRVKPSASPGVRGGFLGVGVFAAGGLADMVWHEVLGIEVAVDALVSPTHLLLLMGGLLMVSAPARTVTARSSTEVTGRVVVSLSVAATAALLGFFTSYVSVFVDPAARVAAALVPEGSPGHRAAELPVVVGLASYLVTTVVIVGPILWTLRDRRRPVVTSPTVVVAAVALLGAGLTEYRFLAPAIGAVVGAAVVELAVVVTRPRRIRLFLGGALPLGIWAGQLMGMVVGPGVGWMPALWAGAVILAGLVGLGMASLAVPSFDQDLPSSTGRTSPRPVEMGRAGVAGAAT